MIEIRKASELDALDLTNLGRSTFAETFAKNNRKDDIDSYIAETFSVDKQTQEIRDSSRQIEIAWAENQAAGFLHLVKSKPDSSVTGPKPVELLRLYVDSRWHGKGVGAALMKRAIQIASNEGFQTLWLGVWERNFKAQTFYAKYNFTKVGAHIFRLGSDNQIDFIMSRII